jgi:hypothetical protein
MRAAIQRHRANRRAGIDAEERGFAIDLGPHQQMILRRANERERDVLQTARLQRPRADKRGQAESSAQQESEGFACAKETGMGKHGRRIAHLRGRGEKRLLRFAAAGMRSA